MAERMSWQCTHCTTFQLAGFQFPLCCLHSSSCSREWRGPETGNVTWILPTWKKLRFLENLSPSIQIVSSIKYGWWIIVDQWDQSFKIIGSTKLQNESITKLQHGSTTKLQATFYTVTNPPAILPWWCLLPKAHLGRFLTCQKETNSSSRFHRFFFKST